MFLDNHLDAPNKKAWRAAELPRHCGFLCSTPGGWHPTLPLNGSRQRSPNAAIHLLEAYIGFPDGAVVFPLTTIIFYFIRKIGQIRLRFLGFFRKLLYTARTIQPLPYVLHYGLEPRIGNPLAVDCGHITCRRRVAHEGPGGNRIERLVANCLKPVPQCVESPAASAQAEGFAQLSELGRDGIR